MTRKQLLTRALICFVIALITLLIMVRYGLCHEPGEDWPENSCGEQVLVIMEQRPDIVVYWGMINQCGHPGHGQWHVQAYDGDKWLSIDRWHNITEHNEPEYTLFPVLRIPGEQWKKKIEKRRNIMNQRNRSDVMNAIDILENWLKENGYDGLCYPEEECGCQIGDLMPCCSFCGHCQPGYRHNDEDGWAIYLKKAEGGKPCLKMNGQKE